MWTGRQVPRHPDFNRSDWWEMEVGPPKGNSEDAKGGRRKGTERLVGDRQPGRDDRSWVFRKCVDGWD